MCIEPRFERARGVRHAVARHPGAGAQAHAPAAPALVGALDLSLVGGVALLDKLVAMGLVPQDQAMGARMMMGLFTVPGEGEDSLTSRIEFTEEGGILANGQQIK